MNITLFDHCCNAEQYGKDLAACFVLENGKKVVTLCKTFSRTGGYLRKLLINNRCYSVLLRMDNEQYQTEPLPQFEI
jgi:hypothetical protein